jgi:hypothetical protein
VKTSYSSSANGPHTFSLKNWAMTAGEDGLDITEGPYKRPITCSKVAIHHSGVKSRQEYGKKIERSNGMSQPIILKNSSRRMPGNGQIWTLVDCFLPTHNKMIKQKFLIVWLAYLSRWRKIHSGFSQQAHKPSFSQTIIFTTSIMI